MRTALPVMAILIVLGSPPPLSAQEEKVEEIPPSVPTAHPVSAIPSSLDDRLQAIERQMRDTEEEQRRLVEENKALDGKKPDPASPKEKEKKAIEFAPYGFIEMIGWANDSLFVGNDLPLYVIDRGQSTTGVTAKGSRLGTKILFPRLEAVTLTATLEVDFVANMADTGYAESYPGVRLRHAVMDLSKTWGDSTLGFKAGQTWATALPNIFPALINPACGWGIGNIWQRMPLAEIYFTQRFAQTFAFTTQIAAARAMTGASSNRNSFLEVNIDAGDASHIPQLHGQLSLTGRFSDIDLLFAVGGAWGRENYKSGVNLNKKEIKYVGGMTDVGLIVSSLKLSHQYAEVAGKFFWGQNLDTFGVFGGSLIAEEIDVTTRRVTGSQRALGWWTQLTMKPLKELALHVGYSSEDPDEKQAGATPLYFNNDALWVSAFYTFFERLTIGFQWIQMQTHDIKLAGAPARRSMTGNTIMGNAKLTF